MDVDLDYLYDIGTYTRVTKSLRTLTHTSRDPAPPFPETGRYLLSVYVVPGTTKTEMQRLLRQVQDLLAARRVTSTWRTGVVIPNSKQRVVGVYPPAAQHPQAVPSQ